MTDLFDLAVVGAGPSGLAAACTVADEGGHVVLFDASVPGGCLLSVREIPEWPDYLPSPGGVELAGQMINRYLDSGGELRLESVTTVEPGAPHLIHGQESTVSARHVLFATGRRRPQLGMGGEAELVGRGLSHCALCDAPLHHNRPVAVFGADDWAISEALLLVEQCRHVTVLCPSPRLRGRARAVSCLQGHARIDVLLDAKIDHVRPDPAGGLAATVRVRCGPARVLAVSGLFVTTQGEPATGAAPVAVLGAGPADPIDSGPDGSTAVAGLHAVGSVARYGGESVLAALAEGSAAGIRIMRG